MTSRRKAAAATALLGQLKGDLVMAMREDEAPTVGAQNVVRKHAFDALKTKWLNNGAKEGAIREDMTNAATVRRHLLAVELKAGLADIRAAHTQRHSEVRNSQHIVENLQLLNENHRLSREKHHLEQSLRRAREGAKLNNAALVGCTTDTGLTGQNDKNFCDENFQHAAIISDDQGVDSGLDPKLESLGTRETTTRPSSAILRSRQSIYQACPPSLQSNRHISTGVHARAGLARWRPQTAVSPGHRIHQQHAAGSGIRRHASVKPAQRVAHKR